MTNIIVTAMLLLGGSAVVNALTGVNIYAASFLIPLGVIVYTLAGGLKATFLASYIHSVIGTLFSIGLTFEYQHITFYFKTNMKLAISAITLFPYVYPLLCSIEVSNFLINVTH